MAWSSKRWGLTVLLSLSAPAWAQDAEEGAASSEEGASAEEPAPEAPAPSPDAPPADAPADDAAEAPADEPAEEPPSDGGKKEGEPKLPVRNAAMVTSSGGVANAQLSPDSPPIPKHRVYYTNLFTGRVNPLGLQNIFRIGYRGRLLDRDGLLFGDTYGWVALSTVITPAFARGGVHLEVSPIALLKLSATWEGGAYFGSFSQLQSWEGTNVDYSDPVINQRDEDGESYSTWLSLLTLSAVLQAKAGPIALRNTLTFQRWDVGLRDGDRVFYEQTSDLLVRSGGYLVQNDLDVIGVVGPARIGARYTYADSFHEQEGGPGDQPLHRLGPLFAYSFKSRKTEPGFASPTLLLITQWHISHPWRAGQVSSQGFPLIILGFAFTGDVLRPK